MDYLKNTKLFLKSLTDFTVLDEIEKSNPNHKYEKKPVETTYKTSPYLIQVRRMYLRDDGIDKTTKQISKYNRKIAKGNKKSIDGHKVELNVGYHKDSLTEKERTEYNHLRNELRDLICSEPNEKILEYLNAKKMLDPEKKLKTDTFLTSKKNIDLRQKLESKNSKKKKKK